MKLYNKTFLLLIIFAIIQGILCPYINANTEISVVNNENDEQIIEEIIEEVPEEEGMKIYSESATLIEYNTGKVLYDKDMYARKYPASTTKILTAIIAIEMCDLNEIATVSYEAVNAVKSGYSIANIQVGESFTIGELINVMMIHSANEAANVIAEHISGSVSEFSNLMNEKARQIGCLDSNFVNANGAHDDNHYSTAYDLALIARYCMQNGKFRDIVMMRECSLPPTENWQDARIFRNTNSLLNPESRYYYPNCIGGKTGFTTPAKNCLISISNRDGFELISVILHAESTEEQLSARYLDTINLFEYGYNNYNLNDILEEYHLIEHEEEIEENKNFFGGLFDEHDENPTNTITNLESTTLIGNSDILEKTEYEVKENYLNRDWIRIYAGTAIICLISGYYIIKLINKNKRIMEKSTLYDFKF